MFKPAEMTKVSITGPKSQLQTVIEEMHRIQTVDLEQYEGELQTGQPFEEAEELSQMLVDVRSLLSKLPETEAKETEFSLDYLQENLDEIIKRQEAVESKINEVEEQISDLQKQKNFFQKIEGTDLTYNDLKGTDKLDVVIGNLDIESLNSEPVSDYEIFQGKSADVIVYRNIPEVERKVTENVQNQINLVKTKFTGTPKQILDQIKREKNNLEKKLEAEKEEHQRLAQKWRGTLEQGEKFLTQKVKKSEAPIKFATTERTFIAKGWVPTEEVNKLQETLETATQGKIHIEKEEGQNPPVKHDNNKAVKPFESLTDLVAIPKYNEIDPSFAILLTFPIMFGFMIGDAGYGLTTLIVFYAAYKKFPEASQIFKSLMYASIATLIFGLAFGDGFGYVIFGHHSELAKVTGMHIFEKIPILFHRAEHLGQVFNIAAIFGIFHVNMGYLLGAYNEYINHGIKEAFLEKGSWILLEIGAALWILIGMTAGAPVIAISIITLYLGEGIEGVVEIPSLLSNILSYLRIFGVSVAAVALAGVVNALAKPLFSMETLTGTIGGIAVLMFGHTFNTFIKIMEGFLQGIRLHYVELFTKFFEGGGRKYSPFGSK